MTGNVSSNDVWNKEARNCRYRLHHSPQPKYPKINPSPFRSPFRSPFSHAFRKSIERYVGSPQAFERISEFFEHCNVLQEAPILDLIDHLIEIPEIDVGKQALFLHAKDNHDKKLDYFMLTGDKRALRAICAYDQLDAFEFLRTKVVCLESCMMDMIDYAGFDYINKKVSAARPQIAEEKYDKVLRAAFGKERNQEHCVDCLRHYCSDIRWLLS